MGLAFKAITSQRTVDIGSKGDRYPTDPANDLLGGFASLAHGEITLAFAQDVQLPSYSISVSISSVYLI